MVQVGKHLGLSGKMAQEEACLSRFWAKDFHGDLTLQVDVLSLIHCCHTAGGKWPKDTIMSDELTNQSRGVLLHVCFFLWFVTASHCSTSNLLR
jgi:hypothetical protein